MVKDLATRIDAKYLLQTNDEPPAYITATSKGWRTGPKEVLESLNDPAEADTIPASQYKFRISIELETGDERYAFLNNCLWMGSGCKRTDESKSRGALIETMTAYADHYPVIFDAYRVG